MKTITLTGEYASQCPELNGRLMPGSYIDKTVPGAGISSLVLENNRDTILLVPNINLIVNKCSQYPNERFKGEILGVYGGVTLETINEYVKSTDVVKIMVTFDSLRKVEHLLDRCDIVVDESDRLLSNVKLKATSKNKLESIDVITYLFNVLEKYKDKVSFVSATPTPLAYMPAWISDLEQVKLEWGNTLVSFPYTMDRGNPTNAVVHEILKPIVENGFAMVSDAKITKVIVFINSITCIKRMIKDAGINKEDVGYIVGDTTSNDVKMKDYSRVSNPYNLSKFTFVTSTGFQGIDLYDEEVMPVVISRTTKTFTLIDISTDLKQAISRQRLKTNKHYGKYIFVYDQSVFDKTEEELLQDINKLRKSIEFTVNLSIKPISEGQVEDFIWSVRGNTDFLAYANYDSITHKFSVNDNLFNADKYFLLETRKQYAKGFRIKALNGGQIIKPVIIPREVSFVDLARHLQRELKTKSIENVVWGDYSTRFENINLLTTYYHMSGKVIQTYKKVKELVEAGNDDSKVVKVEIQSKFKVGETYSRKEVKQYLSNLYKLQGVKRKVSHRDLLEYFDLKEKKITGYDFITILSKK